jgi:hypothetical protein
MVFFGAVAKHDNPSWNKMIAQAKTSFGFTKAKTMAKKKVQDRKKKNDKDKREDAATPDEDEDEDKDEANPTEADE